MKSKKPIIYVLGIEGHLYSAKAMAKEFDRPVIGIINHARFEEFLTPEWRSVFSETYSLPDFYLERLPVLKAMSRKELDVAQNKLEKKLGLTNNTNITYTDRALRWAEDYIKVRHYQLATLEFIDHVMDKTDPAFLIDGVATYLQNGLRAWCHQKDIPYLLTSLSRTSKGFVVMRDDGQIVGMISIYKSLCAEEKDAISQEKKEESDAILEKFQDKPYRPYYAQKNSVIGLQLKRTIKNLKMTLSAGQRNPPEKVRLVDRFLGYETVPLHLLYNGARNKLRRILQKPLNLLDENPDMNVPFFYLPLHYTPEVSDLYFGTDYDHHAGFISRLAKQLPSDAILYAKEHTSMVGLRPLSFYQEIGSLYNVKLIAPTVNTFDLIKNCRSVITVTGTAGWEAFLLGRPVVTLGNIFYNGLTGVLHTQLDNGLKDRIKNYLVKFKSDPENIKNAFRAYHAASYPGYKGDIGHTITREEAPDNAIKFAQGIKKCIQRWSGAELGGTAPDDMLDTNTEKSTPKRASA